MKKPIDIERCSLAAMHIRVTGAIAGSSVRKEAIEDAIKAIQKDGEKALAEEYIGVKQYAGFGDQREDHRYGRCPAHGSIVFCIEARFSNRSKLSIGAEEVYLLECIRDAGDVQVMDQKGNLRMTNLWHALDRMQRLDAEREALFDAISGCTVESHEKAGDGS